MLPYNKDLKIFARELRMNMTETEMFLWQRIRRKQLFGYQFYRQKNIGNYIVDFYCPAAKLIIELDGGQHYSKNGMIRDEQRDSYLCSLGFSTLRFSDREVFKNTEGVIEKICQYLKKSPPTPL
jgi:very-short-patch-repair endonuclease